MNQIRRVREVIRCAISRNCAPDIETGNKDIARLREQEAAAVAATDVVRERRRAMDRASASLERMMADVISVNSRGGEKHVRGLD